MHLSLQPNPSHLEAVNPVVVGKVRARQDMRGDIKGRRSVMGILLHGDAAFAGQGVVYETMAMSQLIGYRTGGTVHIVTNNQIGFTTVPAHAHSGLYCTDIAKAVQAPIWHVNGDDPEAVVFAARLCAEFRQKFATDVVLDMVCYRRYGHNETDEPAFTQPIMYKRIREMRTTRTLYAERLAKEGSVPAEESKAILDAFNARMEEAFQASQSFRPNKADWLEGHWSGLKAAGAGENEERLHATAVPLKTLCEVGDALGRVPEGLRRQPEDRAAARGEAAGDRQRRRHRLGDRRGARLRHPAAGGAPRAPLGRGRAARHLLPAPRRAGGPGDAGRVRAAQQHPRRAGAVRGVQLAAVRVRRARASSTATRSPIRTRWCCGKAQFGDFANGAQVIIDQFIASGEAKWLRMSGLVLLLPHGYEGQGPEHSSARLERYLQMCAERNMRVCNLTTPANYFHALRRQLKANYRKPLVLMTPKSLLRHKLAVSSLSEFGPDSGFQRVIPEIDATVPEAEVRRVVLCSGKVYYDLLQARRDAGVQDVAILRLEQLYSFPKEALAGALAPYTGAEVVWCQEEPENMGAWTFVDRRIEDVLRSLDVKAKRPEYAGRCEAASPATGLAKVHARQQESLVGAALGL